MQTLADQLIEAFVRGESKISLFKPAARVVTKERAATRRLSIWSDAGQITNQIALSLVASPRLAIENLDLMRKLLR